MLLDPQFSGKSKMLYHDLKNDSVSFICGREGGRFPQKILEAHKKSMEHIEHKSVKLIFHSF